MPATITIAWAFTPPDLFEEPTDLSIAEGVLRVTPGRATFEASTDAPAEADIPGTSAIR
jgi:hypothetical protein